MFILHRQGLLVKKTLPSFVGIIKIVNEIKGTAFNAISFIVILMKLYVRVDGQPVDKHELSNVYHRNIFHVRLSPGKEMLQKYLASQRRNVCFGVYRI